MAVDRAPVPDRVDAPRGARLRVTSWILYDLANTVYAAIVTYVFVRYATNELGITQTAVGAVQSASMILAAALVPTLGALAELESAFGNDDMLALAERFSSGRVSARDAIRIIDVRAGNLPGFATGWAESRVQDIVRDAAVDFEENVTEVTFADGEITLKAER